jgi:hypothetical protein
VQPQQLIEVKIQYSAGEPWIVLAGESFKILVDNCELPAG